MLHNVCSLFGFFPTLISLWPSLGRKETCCRLQQHAYEGLGWDLRARGVAGLGTAMLSPGAPPSNNVVVLIKVEAAQNRSFRGFYGSLI